jgi:hypothetical protein
VILGDPKAANAPSRGRATLDDLFRHAAGRRPEAVALADPPNRETFTDGTPRRLTYAEAEGAVAAIAGRLRRLGLQTDSVVALQLPNTVEGVLTILGVLRAGLIAAPLPLLWRRAEAIAALNRLSAKAIITSARIGEFDHGDLAMHVAAEIFPIRYVCGYGAKLADGVIPLDDLITTGTPDPLPPFKREGNPAAHVALITWEMTPDGPAAVARNHLELISGGLAAMLEGRLQPDAVMLGACALNSFPGFALTVMPWLLTGGTLSLHQPFDAAVLTAQARHDRCDTLVLPGPLAHRLADAGHLALPDVQNVLALWRAPERLSVSPPWRHASAGLVDVLAFGETALFGARRGAGGRPAPIPLGPVLAPRGAAGAVLVAEISRTESGTLAVRGPMVPHYPYPPGAERSGTPYFKADPSGLVDTGYTCRTDRDTRALVVTGPPHGIVTVGGYAFRLSDLKTLVTGIDAGAAIAALPDPMLGHRLAGQAADAAGMRAALSGLGVNPLVAEAFAERHKSRAI